MQPIYQVFREGGYAGGWNDVDKDQFDATEEEGRRIVYENAPQPAPHFDDAVVDSFAVAMKEKLALARAKGRHGWETCTDSATLSEMLREHVEKGDPRDVANFCMFLWFHGFSIKQAPTLVAQGARQFAETKEYVIDGGTVVKEPWRLTPADAASEADKRAIPMTGDEIRAICRDAKASCSPSDVVQGSDYVLATLRYLNQRERQQGADRG